MKNIITVLILLFSLVIISCGNSTSGGTVVAPGENDPYVIDGVLCTDIYNNFPSGITNYFYPGYRINLWVNWANITKGQKVTTEWWNPNNNKESESSSVFQSTATKQISISYLDLSTLATKGEWVVKLYLDNSFMRSYRFIVGN